MEPNKQESGKIEEAQREKRRNGRGINREEDLGELLPPAGAWRKDPEAFIRFVRGFYRRSGRDFPWRRTRDPYRILVSEIMLQQTQTSRVEKKYGPFVERFPDFQALAAAPLSEVLGQWQGLGYNRRAVALKKIAETVRARSDRSLPQNEEELRALPMIGVNTAASVIAFAWNRPTVFIETNIRRVYIHHFFPGREQVRDRELRPLIENHVDRDNPREWYYALMDYGVYLKSCIPNPNRRSTAYRRQGSFEGSRRQLRGRVLRLLGSGDRLSPAALSERTGFAYETVDESLEALRQEGFLICENGAYSIRD